MKTADASRNLISGGALYSDFIEWKTKYVGADLRKDRLVALTRAGRADEKVD
jgi:hypothetical protein